jgi:ribose transport system substrate-binding protein
MKSTRVLAAMVAAGALTVSACAGGGPAQGSGFTVGASTYSRSYEFYQEIEAGMGEAAAGKINYQFQDPNGDLAAQTTQVENFVSRGVDLVTLVPVDSDAAEAEGQMVTAAGIPLITVDIAISKDIGQVAHIASDNHEGGELAAQKMSDLLGGTGAVFVIGNPAIASVVDREKGFEEKLAQVAPGVQIVASQSGDSKREKAQAVAEDLLQAHPEVTGIFAVNDEMALGALQAVVAAGRQDSVSIIGFDASSEGLAEIAKGNSPFKATVAQDPVQIGRIVTSTALDVLNGKPVQKVIPVPVTLVDSSNYQAHVK